MQTQEFELFLNKFKESDVDEKIDLFCTTVNLSDDQYQVLLRTFPPSDLRKLEKAMS